MSPKNTAHSVELWLCGMVVTRTVARGGFAALVDTRLVGEIQQPVEDARWHGSAGGSQRVTRYVNWFSKAGTADLGCTD